MSEDTTYPPAILDAIRAKPPISQVVGRRVEREPAGRELKGLLSLQTGERARPSSSSTTIRASLHPLIRSAVVFHHEGCAESPEHLAHLCAGRASRRAASRARGQWCW